MKKLHLLSTVAATLLLTAATASAQTTIKDDAPAHAPAAQQKAPAEKVAPPMQRSERRAPATTGQAAQDEKPAGHKAPLTTGQASPDLKPAEHKAPQATGQMAPKASESDKSQLKTQTMDKSSEQQRSTTGQGAAAGSARLSSDQRSKITTIFKHHRVAPAHLNVSVRVGTRVPESVHFYPLPLEVVDIYPEWRGYDYILVGDEILVIDPHTHEIVAILEA